MSLSALSFMFAALDYFWDMNMDILSFQKTKAKEREGKAFLRGSIGVTVSHKRIFFFWRGDTLRRWHAKDTSTLFYLTIRYYILSYHFISYLILHLTS